MQDLVHAVGKRKTSVARVYLTKGEGNIININGKDYLSFKEYFHIDSLVQKVLQPLVVTNTMGNFNFKIRVKGSGLSGQAGAVRHAISIALAKYNEEFKPILKKEGLLTRDSRMVERKKYGLRKARKREQYSKR
jgi:small subunit ribosomal protein S9